jgi:hypothetical protein
LRFFIEFTFFILFRLCENRYNIPELRSWLSDSLGGRFFLAKSHADVQTGRISGMFSQVEFVPIFELSFYTHLGSSVASVSHLSLKFDLRHTHFIYTRQNITVASSHMSESHIHHIFPGMMSHISNCSRTKSDGRQQRNNQPTNDGAAAAAAAVAAAAVAAAWRRRGGSGSTAAAHSVMAAGDGWGKGKGDRWRDGDTTATECAMMTRWRQKAGRLQRYQDQGGGDRARV